MRVSEIRPDENVTLQISILAMGISPLFLKGDDEILLHLGVFRAAPYELTHAPSSVLARDDPTTTIVAFNSRASNVFKLQR